MEIYKYIDKDNGDILLEKVKINLSDYEVTNIGDKILLQRIINVKPQDIVKYNFSNSTILSCLIANKNISELKYCAILVHVYEEINDGTVIMKNTRLNVKTTIKNDNGFVYLKDLGISVQRVDAGKTLAEILKQCIVNDISFTIKIKLQNKNCVAIST